MRDSISMPNIKLSEIYSSYDAEERLYSALYTEAEEAVVIGSEGRGLTEEVLTLCDRTVRIPMAERCESLNAAIAATVLLWEMSGGR